MQNKASVAISKAVVLPHHLFVSCLTKMITALHVETVTEELSMWAESDIVFIHPIV